MKITEKKLRMDTEGYYILPCDGRHELQWHRYLDYTPEEIVLMWNYDHPKRKTPV